MYAKFTCPFMREKVIITALTPFYIYDALLYFIYWLEHRNLPLFIFARGENMATPEGSFKSRFIKRIENEFPGCIVTKLEADYKEGLPDVLILHKNKWATLEAKKNKSEVTKPRPNKKQQDYYVATMDKMSFSRYVYPENQEEVLNELRLHFQQTRRDQR